MYLVSVYPTNRTYVVSINSCLWKLKVRSNFLYAIPDNVATTKVQRCLNFETIKVLPERNCTFSKFSSWN